MKEFYYEELSNKLLELLLKGNKLECSHLIRRLFKENISFIDIYEKIFKPSM